MRKNGSTPDVSTDSAGDQSFYSRWSQRKKQLRAGQQPDPDPEPEPTGAGSLDTLPQDQLPQRGEVPETPLLTDADMPPLESLDAESDYSGFMSEGVSEELRNKALRKLFLSPQFNIVDGLDDYCEDFTNFEALGDIITADMRYEREYEAQRVLEREQERKQKLKQEQELELEQKQEQELELEQKREQEQEREQESAQELQQEQAQTAALESDSDSTDEARDGQQSTPLDTEASAVHAATAEAEGGSDPSEGDVEDGLIRGKAGAESDESQKSAAENGGNNQGGTMT